MYYIYTAKKIHLHQMSKNTHITCNAGTKFQPDWFEKVQINRTATERRVASLLKRRSLKRQYQAGWLITAISCMDLTTLAGDDTPDRVKRLAHKAKHVLRPDIVAGLGLSDSPPTVGAVCVYPTMVAHAIQVLQNTNIPVAAVATGFPAGLIPLNLRLAEILYAVEQGAMEIDIVIPRAYILNGNWQALYDELVAMKQACGTAHIKAILATGDIKTLKNVYIASMIAMQAGCDFIKTSTGKESVNATLPVSLTMVRAIRDYYHRTGYKVGFKPAGGISTTRDAIAQLILIKEELGNDWLNATRFRLGASALLTDIERQLEHFVSGRYSANHRHTTS